MPYERCKHGMWPSECILCLLDRREESRLGVVSNIASPTPPPEGEKIGIVGDSGYEDEEEDLDGDGAVGSRSNGRKKGSQNRARNVRTNGRTPDITPLPSPPSLLTSVDQICSVCKQHRPVHKNRDSGKLMCQNCRKKDLSTREKCSKCGKVKPVAARNESGEVFCGVCYYQPQRRTNMAAARPARTR